MENLPWGEPNNEYYDKRQAEQSPGFISDLHSSPKTKEEKKATPRDKMH